MANEKQKLGNYKLRFLLNKTSLTELWLVEDLKHNRERKLRLIPHLTGVADKEFSMRFLDQSRMLSGLVHPAILPIIDYGSIDSYYYLVMPYHSEETLRIYLAGKKVSLNRKFKIFQRGLEALSFAHSQGIIHQHLSPDSFLINNEQELVITDFGLLRIESELKRFKPLSLDQTDLEGGFLAPEQFNGFATYHSDLYSMGLILYWLITNKTLPLVNQTNNLHTALSYREFPSGLGGLSSPLLAAELGQFLVKALENKPKNRFSSAEQMLAEFRRITATIRETSVNGELDLTLEPSGSAPIEMPVIENEYEVDMVGEDIITNSTPKEEISEEFFEVPE